LELAPARSLVQVNAHPVAEARKIVCAPQKFRTQSAGVTVWSYMQNRIAETGIQGAGILGG
jgi:hypothetical protein